MSERRPWHRYICDKCETPNPPVQDDKPGALGITWTQHPMWCSKCGHDLTLLREPIILSTIDGLYYKSGT